MGSKILQKCTYVADIGIETLKTKMDQKWTKIPYLRKSKARL